MRIYSWGQRCESSQPSTARPTRPVSRSFFCTPSFVSSEIFLISCCKAYHVGGVKSFRRDAKKSRYSSLSRALYGVDVLTQAIASFRKAFFCSLVENGLSKCPRSPSDGFAFLGTGGSAADTSGREEDSCEGACEETGRLTSECELRQAAGTTLLGQRER